MDVSLEFDEFRVHLSDASSECIASQAESKPPHGPRDLDGGIGHLFEASLIFPPSRSRRRRIPDPSELSIPACTSPPVAGKNVY